MTTASYIPHIDIADILAAQNPHIDLRVDEYERSKRSMVNLATNYAKRNAASVLENKNSYTTEKSRLAEKIQTTKIEINQCKEAEIQLMEVLQQEQEERKESEAVLNALKRRLASIKQKCASVDSEIEQYRSMVTTLEQEKEREENILRSRAQEVNDKLRACQEMLHGVIEGIAIDLVLVRFTHIDPSDLDREFSFVIDTSNRIYKVPTSTPFLPTLPILVDELNRTRDLYNFIKQVWGAFDELTMQE